MLQRVQKALHSMCCKHHIEELLYADTQILLSWTRTVLCVALKYIVRLYEHQGCDFVQMNIWTFSNVHFVPINIWTFSNEHFVQMNIRTFSNVQFVPMNIWTFSNEHFVQMNIWTFSNEHFVQMSLLCLTLDTIDILCLIYSQIFRDEIILKFVNYHWILFYFHEHKTSFYTSQPNPSLRSRGNFIFLERFYCPCF